MQTTKLFWLRAFNEKRRHSLKKKQRRCFDGIPGKNIHLTKINQSVRQLFQVFFALKTNDFI